MENCIKLFTLCLNIKNKTCLSIQITGGELYFLEFWQKGIAKLANVTLHMQDKYSEVFKLLRNLG